MMCNIKEEILKVEVKSEDNFDNALLPDNKHPVGDNMDSMVEDYSRFEIKKEFEYIDYDELNADSLKQVNASYVNFKCKEEIKDEELNELSNKFITENQTNVEAFAENSDVDEKIDISTIVLQPSDYNDDSFKIESENQKALRQSVDDPLKQGKEKPHRLTMKNCQLCNKSFVSKPLLKDHLLKEHKQEIKGDLKSFMTRKKCSLDRHGKIKRKCHFCAETFKFKQSLDGHLLRKHKDKIKNDIQSFITSKIYVCKICNSYETTHKSNYNSHINWVHNEVKDKVKCQFCTESFIGRRSLDEHVLRKHKDKIKNEIKSFITSKIHVCKTCNSFETTNKSNFKRHINSAHNEVSVTMECRFCTEIFTEKGSLDEHVLNKHNDKIENKIKSLITSKIHVCKICNSFETTNKSNFDRHVNSAHNEVKTKMKCQFCPCSFTSKISLDGHVLKKHKDKIKDDIKSFITRKIHVCEICNTFETPKKSNLDQHINSVHNERKIKMKCQFCTDLFFNKRSLDGHLLRKHKDKIESDIKSFITSKIYICTICNSYETTDKSGLNWHINSVHNKVKITIQCQFCAESFIHKRSLDGHLLRKHRDKIKKDMKSFISSKIHVCKICNSFETTIKSNLDDHINSVHNDVKIKLKCQFCPDSFMSKISLDGHTLRKHKDNIKDDIKSFITRKIHVCEICNSFETTKKSNLNQHINAVHNKGKMKCQFCTESFRNKRSLDGHILKKHSDKIKGEIGP